MIQLDKENKCKNQVVFIYKNQADNIINCNNQIKGQFLSYFHLFTNDNSLQVSIGLGDHSAFSRRKIKSVLAKAVKQMQQLEIAEFSVDVSLFIERYGIKCIFDIVEGIKLGAYKYSKYKSKEKNYDYNVLIKGINSEDTETAGIIIQKAENIIDGVIFARDMVNAPGNKLTPGIMAEKITSFEAQAGLTVKVLEGDQLEQLGMHAFLTVGSSSSNPPKLIVIKYEGDKESNQITALIGKGVTCDTGGYCLKPADSMIGIKGDMAGGAAVAGAIYSLAKNHIKTNVVGIIPGCENRISSRSFLPGDVIDSMSGKTIEIINTDAEGRLILADSVTYAIKKENVNRILDVATLTGAVVNALGFTTAGLLANNKDFYKDFKEAAELSGEQYWQYPIYEEYSEMLKSNIADIKNIGKSYCGTITAGLFIEAFVEKLPWIHLDIAGTAWVDPPVYEYQSIGATGASVTSMYFLFDKELQLI